MDPDQQKAFMRLAGSVVPPHTMYTHIPIPIHGDLGLDVETWLVWALNIGKTSFVYKFTKRMRNK